MQENENMERILAALLVGLPSAALSIIGSLAYCMTKNDPQINTTRTIGIVMLSGFTGWVLCVLLLQTGLHAELAAAVSASIGSGGIKGYEWLLKRAESASKLP